MFVISAIIACTIAYFLYKKVKSWRMNKKRPPGDQPQEAADQELKEE